MNQLCASGNDLSSVLDSLPSMATSSEHSTRARTGSRTPACLLALLCFIGTACGTTPLPGKILFDDPRGTVSLQTISDRSIQANHPITLDPALLAKLLHGIMIRVQEHGVQSMVGNKPPGIPVFSEGQIEFLAPLLAEGLRAAGPDQAVAYRVYDTHQRSSLESPIKETTTGSLFAYGRQLYVILSQYRYDPISANLVTAGQPLQVTGQQTRLTDRSGLWGHTLLFIPREAQRSDRSDPPTGGEKTDKFVAVDYELLQHVSTTVATTEQTAPQPGTGASEASAQAAQAAEALAQHEKDLAQREAALAQREVEIQRLKDVVNKNVSEVETMRKELQSVQKQLESQPTRQDLQKQKTAPQQK